MDKLDSNARGALFMVVCMLAFTLNDTLMKLVLADIPLFQAVFLRGLVASSILVLIAWRMGGLAHGKWHVSPALLLRVGAEIGGTVCFFSALQHIPISDATAITQVTPLAVTLGAALFLGEKVGWRRLLAIAIGFAGVMLIVRPGSGSFSPYSYYALACVFFIALRDLATRRLATSVPSTQVALVTSVSMTVFAGLGARFNPWTGVEPLQIALLASAAALLCVGYIFSIMTMRIGDVSFSAPFRYVALVWALVAGVVVFGDLPDGWMLLGSAIVVATGIYTFYRERGLARRTRISSGEADVVLN